MVDKLDPKRITEHFQQLAEKNRPKEIRPEPKVESATPLKNLLATDFQRKILSELDAKRSQTLEYSGYVAKRDKDDFVEESVVGGAIDFGVWNDLGGEQEKKPASKDIISTLIDALPQRSWVDVKVLTDDEKEARQFM